ncbi:MAG: hypothetical protein R6V05_08890 [Candidatus Brocadiia bacterium]
MALWAGIDEAGYGPPLGPLVVGCAAFELRDEPSAGIMWELLSDAVCRSARGSAGRLVINDSKEVYSPARGLKLLEDGVLGVVSGAMGRRCELALDLLRLLGAAQEDTADHAPWFAGAPQLGLPVASNPSAVESKAELLRSALGRSGVRLMGVRAAVVLPAEYNRVVARTRNKSLLLFQRCGLLLQGLWRQAGPGPAHVTVDRHGARMRYRRLLRDAFPQCQCDILGEESSCSAYRICGGDRALHVTFLEEADRKTLPAALASMLAKYVRELYMTAFNRYWGERVPELRPTAGYGRDAHRFLRDIAPVLKAEGVERKRLVRSR